MMKESCDMCQCDLTAVTGGIVPNHETGGNWLMCDHCKRVHQLKEMIKATIEVASVKLHHPAVDSDAYRRGKEHGILETCKAMLKQIERLS